MLVAWSQGDEAALENLIPLVDQELRRIARRCLEGEETGHSPETTALAISPATVMRDWTVARFWLMRELTRGATA